MSEPHSGFNESHQRRLLVTFQYVDKLLSEMEAVLSASSSKSPFPKYVANFTPAQERVVRDYIARARSQIHRVRSEGVTNSPFLIHPTATPSSRN